MKYSDKIIKFMEFKQEKITEIYRLNYSKAVPNYFTEEDAKSIKNWPSQRCKKVWSRLMLTCNTQSWCHPLSSVVCPFCIEVTYSADKKYESCEYGKNHGLCVGEKNSDYQKIRKKFDFITKKLNKWPSVKRIINITTMKNKLQEIERESIKWCKMT